MKIIDLAVEKIGLAGYMGAGKSTCAAIIASMNGLVIDADQEAKNIMKQNLVVKNELVNAFGTDIVNNDALDFLKLGNIAFSSIENLQRLNAIVHPLLLEQLNTRINACTNEICILDAALIPHWCIESWFDACIWVEAPYSDRLQRLVKKSEGQIEPTELENRLRLQQQIMPVPNKAKWQIIKNNDSIADLHSQINILLDKVLQGVNRNHLFS